MHASAKPALAVDLPLRRGARYRGADRLPHVPRYRNHHFANGGALEHAQEMAAQESPRTTKLSDRTKERLTQDEVEQIGL
jgi:hypothetical protein